MNQKYKTNYLGQQADMLRLDEQKGKKKEWDYLAMQKLKNTQQNSNLKFKGKTM